MREDIKLFEVKDGTRRLFWTEHESCIPSREIRKQMRSVGLRLFLNGKPFLEKEARA